MRRYRVEVGGRTHVVDVQEVTSQQFRVKVEGRELDVRLSAAEDISDTVISPEIVPTRRGTAADALSASRFRPPAPDTLPPMVKVAPPPLGPAPEKSLRLALKAPMPGTILSVEVEAGESVTAGQVLMKLEAMKMVNAIKAPQAGRIADVHVEAGQSVGHGQVLVTFAEA
jgi:biotin carboxyl carrier protein